MYVQTEGSVSEVELEAFFQRCKRSFGGQTLDMSPDNTVTAREEFSTLGEVFAWIGDVVMLSGFLVVRGTSETTGAVCYTFCNTVRAVLAAPWR
jgi:hypothetical protein